MDEHHGGEETAIPHFRGTVAAEFKGKVVFQALVAAFRGSTGIVLALPLRRIPWGDIEEPWVIFTGKVNSTAEFGVGTGIFAGAKAGTAIHEGAAKLGTVFGSFAAVMAHFKTGQTDGDAVGTNGEIVFVSEFNAPFFIEIDKRDNAVPAAILVDWHGIVSGIKEKFGNLVFR